MLFAISNSYVEAVLSISPLFGSALGWIQIVFQLNQVVIADINVVCWSLAVNWKEFELKPLRPHDRAEWRIQVDLNQPDALGFDKHPAKSFRRRRSRSSAICISHWYGQLHAYCREFYNSTKLPQAEIMLPSSVNVSTFPLTGSRRFIIYMMNSKGSTADP